MHKIFVCSLLSNYIAATSVTTTINRTGPATQASLFLLWITASSLSTVFIFVLAIFLFYLEILPPMLHSIHFAAIVNNSNISVAYKNKHVFLAARRAYGWLRICFPHLCIPESKLKEQFLLGPGRAVQQAQTLEPLGTSD